MANIGIFGGTFNPPHNGHVKLASNAVSQLGLKSLYIIPSRIPPHKETDSTVSPEERLTMCRLAFSGIAKTQVSTIELEREGKSYTVDTLRILRKKHPNDSLVLLMGSDMFLSIEAWKEFREIFKLCSVAVFERDAECAGLNAERVEQLAGKYDANVTFVKAPIYSISSTEIRFQIQDHGLRRFLPVPVADYILDNHLYADAGVEQLLQMVHEQLSESRFTHTVSVANEAVRLACRFGCDISQAREAGILHDITKEFSTDAQLQLCRKFDIILDKNERLNRKLLHAKTGPYYAKALLGGLDEDVFHAIEFHTTGRQEMSKLEKIIYLADYIEPLRSFDGVDEVRLLARRDLDAALLLALNQTIGFLELQGREIHQNTLLARDFLAEKGAH